MIIAGDTFPWLDFWLFLAQIIGCVVGTMVLMIAAVATGVKLTSATEQMSCQTVFVFRVALFGAMVIPVPLAIGLLTASMVVTMVAIMASLTFAIVALTTERETLRSQPDRWLK